MIKHIVMWQLKPHAEGADKVTNAAKMKSLLDACANIVPGMGAFEVALAQEGMEATYDVVLYSEFESLAALDAYQNTPSTSRSSHLSAPCARRGNAWTTK
jgi:heme-degrading monooxygenase HmoA